MIQHLPPYTDITPITVYVELHNQLAITSAAV